MKDTHGLGTHINIWKDVITAFERSKTNVNEHTNMYRNEVQNLINEMFENEFNHRLDTFYKSHSYIYFRNVFIGY